MKKQWILVANSSLARILRRDSALEPLVPVESMKRIKLTHSNDFTSLDLAELETHLATMREAGS